MDLQTILQFLATLFGFFLLAFWVSLALWTYRDISSRSTDSLVRTLAVLLVAVFNLPGLFLYFILRPKETIAETYERSLEEEALLQEIEERDSCPVCKQPVREDYLVCPNCHTQLKKSCSNCGRLLLLRWDLCPYCGTPSPTPSLSPTPVMAEEAGKRTRS